ncbi:macrophage migration inhibitory factor homolog [Oppia nitens]|uniref:macrophage migration inhibitory factor homolog n=1 Tax=Oppia nitens TaxID=1686743 RepID=UPI0023DA50EB|nr:macrophage migration inhibitory factor homolog [Oppia nitens]
MPIFKLSTNLPASKLPAGFADKTAEMLANSFGKPKAYVAVQVVTDQIISWGGTDSGPCGLATVESTDGLGSDQNKKHSKAIADHLQKELGIGSDKCYIIFVDIDKVNLGYMGTTCEQW